MLSQIIRVVSHLCGQGNLITTVWNVRESRGIFIIKQSGNPVIYTSVDLCMYVVKEVKELVAFI